MSYPYGAAGVPMVPHTGLHPPNMTAYPSTVPPPPPPPPSLTAPLPVKPPQNNEVHQRIDKLVEYLYRSGPDFERMIIAKQGQDPLFAFLFQGGADHAYYQWRTYAVIQRKWNDEQITTIVDQYMKHGHLPAPAPPPPPPPPLIGMRLPVPLPASSVASASSVPSAPLMPPNLEAEFQRLLDDLSGSKEGIKNGRRWVLDHSESAPRITELISRHMLRLTPSQFEKKLYVIYLLNDILFATLKKRSSVHVMDYFANALLPHLPHIVSHGYVGHAAADQAKLMKILRQWGERDVFPAHAIDKIETDAKNIVPATATATPSAAAALLASITTPSTSSSSVTASSLSTLLHLGPGFIVTLTKQHNGNMAPYSLLDPLKIPPSLPREYNTPPDRHLLDALDDFYNEIRDEENGSSSSSSRSSAAAIATAASAIGARNNNSSRSRSRSRSPSPSFGGDSPERRRRYRSGGGGGVSGASGGSRSGNNRSGTTSASIERSRSPSARSSYNNNTNTNRRSRERDSSSSVSRHGGGHSTHSSGSGDRRRDDRRVGDRDRRSDRDRR